MKKIMSTFILNKIYTPVYTPYGSVKTTLLI